MIFVKVKFLFLLITVTLLIGCVENREMKQAETNASEPKLLQDKGIVFCPQNIEPEARKILGLDKTAKIQLQTLLTNLSKNGISYEVSSNSPFQCPELKTHIDDMIYMVDGGWSKDKSHKKGFIVVASGDGNVRFIEERHSYLPPKLWSD